jgi:short subunit dehydrogenase-like uncharacterized protein
MQTVLKKLIAWMKAGPTEAEREEDECVLWGEVTNAVGKQVVLQLHIPEGYTLAKDAVVTAVVTLLQSGLSPGTYTPSLAFGPEFVLGLHGVEGPRVA